MTSPTYTPTRLRFIARRLATDTANDGDRSEAACLLMEAADLAESSAPIDGYPAEAEAVVFHAAMGEPLVVDGVAVHPPQVEVLGDGNHMRGVQEVDVLDVDGARTVRLRIRPWTKDETTDVPTPERVEVVVRDPSGTEVRRIAASGLSIETIRGGGPPSAAFQYVVTYIGEAA